MSITRALFIRSHQIDLVLRLVVGGLGQSNMPYGGNEMLKVTFWTAGLPGHSSCLVLLRGWNVKATYII